MTEYQTESLDLRYLVMESAPGYFYPGGIDMEFAYDSRVPDEVMQAIEDRHLMVVDEGECDLCTKPVGYVLYDEDDAPGNGTRWHWTTAAWQGEHTEVLLLCEECSPHVMADLFEQRAKPQPRPLTEVLADYPPQGVLMPTIENEGWLWKPSIGLYYGTGPNGEREAIAQPVMTSRWVVVCSEHEDEGTTFVRIFPHFRAAMQYVAQKQEVGA